MGISIWLILILLVISILYWLTKYNGSKHSNKNKGKKLRIDTGDTSFLFLVNADLYQSYIGEDWDFDKDLIPHLKKQQELGHILMYTLNTEVTLNKWAINTYLNKEVPKKNHIKKAKNYIEVSNNKLYFIDYTCLTMAAQFADECIPNSTCKSYMIELDNGRYEVQSFLYTNIENENKLSRQEDMDVYFNLDSNNLISENHEIDWT